MPQNTQQQDAVQPDLFGEFDAAVTAQTAKAAAAVELLARFERRDFPAPYDSASHAKGDVVHGWVCPGCGGVEWGEFTLELNHGYQTYNPAFWPGSWAGAAWGETCNRLIGREYRAAHGLPVGADSESSAVVS